MRSRVSSWTVLTAVLLAGCTSTRTTNTARTAREQLLVSNAVDQALSKVDFAAFQGAKIFIDDKYLECVDKGYLVGSIRHRAMTNGAMVVAKVDDADVALELRSGVIGTDSADAFVGTPEIVLPGMLTLPEVRLISRNNQSAMAKIGIVAYNPKTNQLLGEGGVSSSMSRDNNWFVLGVGPYQNGEVKTEIQRTTGRQPGQPHQELPTTVAFQEPAGTPARVQLTGDQTEE
ncbi:MAG TPA: DUF6655 family protein [Planctomycetaceae bacterium]|nr:DUF6655 family protein [Planctomycetaceae bacterium]